MLISPQKKEETERRSNKIVVLVAWSTGSSLLTKLNNMSILLPISWIKMLKELLDFYMCCQVLGLHTVIRH